LSRAALIACALLRVKTPSCSNCRTTAVPNMVIDAPMRGMTAS
jgi:hypothetical protein